MLWHQMQAGNEVMTSVSVLRQSALGCVGALFFVVQMICKMWRQFDGSTSLLSVNIKEPGRPRPGTRARRGVTMMR